jgi:hypothetical protein
MSARSKSAGWRLDLGDDLEAKLADFASAFYKANKTEIVREALDWYIDKILAEEPARRARYEDARRRRGIGSIIPIRPVRTDKAC